MLSLEFLLFSIDYIQALDWILIVGVLIFNSKEVFQIRVVEETCSEIWKSFSTGFYFKEQDSVFPTLFTSNSIGNILINLVFGFYRTAIVGTPVKEVHR